VYYAFIVLTAYRRHRAKCKHRSRRYKGCSCPIWIQGTLEGRNIRRSLDLTNWEAAQNRIRELEIFGEGRVISVEDACSRFLADVEARGIGPAQTSKYKLLTKELTAEFGAVSVREISVDDLRRYREKWKLSPISASKKLERMRTLFSFCLSSGWIQQNPARGLKVPSIAPAPTLPFTDEEMEKILWAAESIREAHPKMLPGIERKLLALILLMRYSGIRISDAVAFRRDQLKNGKLFLRQAKTKHPVWVPVPPKVVKALAACDEGQAQYFYSGSGKLKSAITEWQDRLKKVYEMAGIPDGHSHRLRDTFAVALLNEGVPLETVSILLGHRSIKTTEKHYAPWVKSRQKALEEAVKATWA
jgi:integrase/recombinase XerD